MDDTVCNAHHGLVLFFGQALVFHHHQGFGLLGFGRHHTFMVQLDHNLSLRRFPLRLCSKPTLGGIFTVLPSLDRSDFPRSAAFIIWYKGTCRVCKYIDGQDLPIHRSRIHRLQLGVRFSGSLHSCTFLLSSIRHQDRGPGCASLLAFSTWPRCRSSRDLGLCLGI